MKRILALVVRFAASGGVMLAVATAWMRPDPATLDWPLWIVLCGALVIAPAGLALLNHVFHDEPPDVGRDDPVCLSLRAAVNIGLVAAGCLPAGKMAAVGVLPWLALTVATSGRAAWWLWHRHRKLDRWLVLAATVQLAGGAFWLLGERLGRPPWGYDAMVARVTAAHFHFAGFLLPLAAALLIQSAKKPSPALIVGSGTVLVGFPAVAVCILGRRYGLPIGVESLVAAAFAAGALIVGAFQTSTAFSCRDRAAGAFLGLGGVALMVGSTFALLFALRPWLPFAELSWPTTWAWHGSIQALGFAVPTVLAWRRVVRKNEVLSPVRRLHGASQAVWVAVCD